MSKRNGQSSCCDTAGCPPDCCPEYQSIRARPLLEPAQQRQIVNLFKVLANETRIQLLHLIIKAGEISVNDLATQMEMTPQAVSNQLQKLLTQQIVETRRDGNLIYYRVIDPCVTMLLDRGLCLLEFTESKKKRASKRRSTT